MTYRRTLIASASMAALAGGAFAQVAQNADDGDFVQDEVVVTGSAIAGTAEDAALPVDVLTAADLRLEGNPTITELVRNLGVSTGVDGETNQFASNGLEGSSNINLRGLGPARTLVLINGRRQAAHPYAIGEQAQLFVDTNAIPAAAIGRIEVLKDGAAAIYGSDAIAGVVNFITRDDLDGFELGGTYQTFEGSDGEFNVHGAYGLQRGGLSWVTTLQYNYRSEVPLLEKDWAIQDFADNPVGGWSTIGNPGSFVATPNIGPGVAAAGTPLAFANADEQCGLLGGVDAGVLCRFQFTQFDNLVEEESRIQGFSELDYTFANGVEFHGEAMYNKTDVPEWKTSPSYPPQALFGQLVLPNHPGLQRFIQDNPGWAAATYTDFAPLLVGGTPGALDPNTTPLIFFGRSFGFGGFPGTGGAQTGERNYETYRLGAALNGDFENGSAWDLGLTWSQVDGFRLTNDTYTLGLANALQGFGLCSDPITGAVPQGAVPGQGGCEYYNPFSNSIAASAITGVANPQFDPALANSPELADWLTDPLTDDARSELLVFDAVVSGELDRTFGAANIGYALGAQIRNESYSVDPNDFNDIDVFPGTTGSGPFSFLAGRTAFDGNQTILALFTELQLAPTDDIDLQLAARYERYEGDIGATFDPKVAAKWSITDAFALRGSAQTSFRGPTLNQLDGVVTTLQFVAPTGAFKAVDQFGNPELDPERAFSFNLGAIFETPTGFFASLDYYSFDFSDPIIVEDQNSIVDSVVAALGAGRTTAPILNRVVFQNPLAPSAAGIARIRTNVVNGPDIETSGVDLRLEQNFNDFGIGDLVLAFEGSYIIEYVVDDFVIDGELTPGTDRVGQFNRGNFSRSLPQLKANLTANYGFGPHNVRGVVRYTDSYEDERPAVDRGGVGETIDEHVTLDLYYAFQPDNLPFDISASVVNVTDEDPPFAAFDLNYDPYTHNPFGRVFKVGATYRFGGSGR